jgi:hypothetical protein
MQGCWLHPLAIGCKYDGHETVAVAQPQMGPVSDNFVGPFRSDLLAKYKSCS